MPDEAQSSAASTASEELAVLNGGVEVDVEKIDGSLETVTVRQLPISLVGQWRDSQADEAFIVELLCDRFDKSTQHHLAHARMSELRVMQMLRSAPFDQLEPIEKRLQALRTEIAALEQKPRWSDSLKHESVARIRELGHRLNKKKAVDQIKRQTAAAKDLLAETNGSESSNSSSQSRESATSTSAS
jgi:hypothetical protein